MPFVWSTYTSTSSAVTRISDGYTSRMTSTADAVSAARFTLLIQPAGGGADSGGGEGAMSSVRGRPS